MSHVVVIMGVSGSGKSTVGRALAERLGAPFYDGDDFHPPQNIAKMADGIPLDDDDRFPWLARLHAVLADHLARGQSAVLACSALKERYRDQLRRGNAGVRFVYLHGSADLIRARLAARPDHFMKADLLASQFDALEPPAPHSALILSATDSVDALVAHIVRYIDQPRPPA